MFSKNELCKTFINDVNEHPERINVSIERIEEVLKMVIGEEKAENICNNKLFNVKNKRAQIEEEKANSICDLILENINYDQLQRIILMFQDSEISTQEAIELHEKFKIPVSHLEKDIIPVRGEGAWIVSNQGKTYLDVDSNYSATNLGMNNEEIAKGLYNQASQLISMKEDRVHIPRSRFLKSITGMMPEGLTNFYWQNSGGEAVDKSIKIAKAFTNHRGVIALENGFHGRTHGALAVTYNLKYRKPFGLENEDWVHFVKPGEIDEIEDLFKENKARSIILELVQGEEAGIKPLDKRFVSRIRKICDKYNGVMICDEVQSGFGRVAKKEGEWFASHTYNVIPDIMVIGKSFGGGYPVTAVVSNDKISDAMKGGYDGSTFGGNPMAMVAALIATRQMRELNITKNVVERSKQIFDGLDKIDKKFDIFSNPHGMGMMIGFDLPSADDVNKFQDLLVKYRVKSSLSTNNTVRFLPPLILSEIEGKFLLSAIEKALEDM